MGALDKRIFSGVAMLSALLFVVSAVMLLSSGSEVTADGNDAALYILIVSGILAVVFGAALVMDRSSFVRTLSGGLAALTGILFLAVPFAGESTGTLLAVASIVAAVTIVADMLALWVSRIYGAMYVAAVLAAVDIAMGILYFAGSTQVTYHAIALIVFGIWLALSAYVFGFVKVEPVAKTRAVTEDLQTAKGDRPQAKNKKATKKAKRPERKEEPKQAEGPGPEPVEAPKAEEPKAEEPKEAKKPEAPVQEEKPKARPAPRPVELPKREAPRKPVETKVEEPKAEPKAEASREEPKVAETKAEEPKTEAPREEPKKETPKAKSMDDFMKKLMSSENANRVKRETPIAVEPKVHEPAPVPEPVETKVEGPKEASVVEEPVPAVTEAPIETIEEPEPEEVPVEEIAEEVSESEESETEEAPVENEPVPEIQVEEPVEAEPVETIQEEEPEPQPDWSMVSHDASQVEPETVPEPEVIEEPVQEPEPAADEPTIEEAPAEEPVIEEPVQETSEDQESSVSEEPEAIPEAEPEPVPEVVEDVPVEEPVVAPEEPSGPVQEPVIEEPKVEDIPAEAAPETVGAEGQANIETSETQESGEEVLGEDIYTDYSPEAVVRRAAWNKGLRCRRGYGEFNIPVAFVKGKVAVYVDSEEPDTTHDAELRDMGWTVLRYDASTVTDGKAQGDEIAAAVKANMRSAKAAAKKKSKK